MILWQLWEKGASDSYKFLWILAEACSEMLSVYPAFVLIFSTAVLDPDLCPWCQSSSSFLPSLGPVVLSHFVPFLSIYKFLCALLTMDLLL